MAMLCISLLLWHGLCQMLKVMINVNFKQLEPVFLNYYYYSDYFSLPTSKWISQMFPFVK